VEAVPALPITSEVTVHTPASAPPELPVEAIAEPVAEVPAAVASALHTDTPSLLETAGKPEDKPKAEEKPAEAPKPAETPELPAYEAFKLPEGVPLDESRVEAFKELIGPHRIDQDTAQKLVDLHTEVLQQYRDGLLAQQHTAFADTRRGWVDKIKADPVLGGSGFNTALMAAARMRDLLVPEAHRAEFEDFMRMTGAGDHPALMRLLHTAARIFDEPTAPPIPARPVPDRGGSAKPSRGAAMYDHPSSRRAAGRG
jgi:hypothetical protein